MEEEGKIVYIDTALRGLRFSFGLVNTILVFILVKPFQEPIFNIKNWVQAKLSRQNIP